jgi:hypothetical protein
MLKKPVQKSSRISSNSFSDDESSINTFALTTSTNLSELYNVSAYICCTNSAGRRRKTIQVSRDTQLSGKLRYIQPRNLDPRLNHLR